MMAYKTVVGTHEVKKYVHMLLNLIAIILGIIGIHAAFKYHDRENIGDMYSLHSWIGMGTFCLFILQVTSDIENVCVYKLYAGFRSRDSYT